MIAEVAAASVLGLLTAISPCPLATNIAAISYIGRHAATPRRSLWAGIAYVLGRTLCYIALAGVLAAGLLAASTASEALNRYIGVLIGPLLVIAGAILLDLISVPAGLGSLVRQGGQWSERLAQRGNIGGSMLLGVVFALSFCPASAALFFGSLVPLAAESQSAFVVPASYGIGTGLPVLAFAFIIAAGGHGLGRMFDKVSSIECWLRRVAGVKLIAIGIYLSLRNNFGL